jgi:rRNA small subunit pseudouridine methyltransferase Nep1
MDHGLDVEEEEQADEEMAEAESLESGSSSGDASSTHSSPHLKTSKKTVSNLPPEQRPTKPLPKKNLHTPSSMQYSDNPHMLPVQHHVARSSTANNQRRLFVILERACLEAYRISSSKKGGKNGEGDVKYALLNCDDHQGILAKTGRDIADARPDITHQVGPTGFRCAILRG